ncbi:hypothetical protein [Nocardia sp. SC052]|uniref:hypothetical protein n=1 Tax=Nocardia sichangensis TaxID=3385975 RepID=UPI0039A02776
MKFHIYNELHQDFRRWLEFVDHAAHAENEVEGERPAMRSAELAQKWIANFAEEWNAMCDLHEQRCANKARPPSM